MMQSKKADSQVTEKWISDVKRAWKYHKSQIEKVSEPMEFENALKEAATYFMRLQEDLLINKGFWYVLGPYSGEADPKLRDKITSTLHEAGQALWSLATVSKLVGKGRRTLEDLEDMISEDLKEVDSKLSRIVFATLKRELKKVDNLDMGSFVPNTVDLKGVKVIFKDKAEKNPKQYQHQYKQQPTSPVFRDTFIDSFKKAHALLERKGLGHLWYGEFLVGNLEKSGVYTYTDDKIYFSTVAADHKKLAYVTIHELGHRHWFQFMSSHDRVAFSAYFHTGEVDPVTDYGGTNPEEDFAEAFANYVMGKNLDRDQIERFKQFFGQRISSDTKKIAMATRITRRRIQAQDWKSLQPNDVVSVYHGESFKKFFSQRVSSLDRKKVLARRVADRIASKQLAYHGTSSKFLRRILKEGLIPNPTQRRWDDIEEGNRKSLHPVGPLEDYVYLAYFPYIVRDVASSTVDKFGGNPLFVVAQISRGSAALDHDTLSSSIPKAARKVADTTTEGSLSSLLGYLQNSDTGTRIRISEEFADIIHRGLKKEGDNPLLYGENFGDEQSYPATKILMLYLFYAYEAEGNPSEFLKGFLKADQEVWKRYPQDLSTFASDLDDWGMRDEFEEDLESVKNKWPMNVSNPDEEWRNAVEHVAIRYRGQVSEMYEGKQSVMVKSPITYRGSNKVVAVLEIVNDQSSFESRVIVHYNKLGSLDPVLKDLAPYEVKYQ